MDLITLLLVLMLMALPSIYFLQTYKKWKQVANEINRIPGPKTYPVFGTTWALLNTSRTELFNTLRERAMEFRPFYRTWIGSKAEIHIMKPEHLEIVMSSLKHSEKGLSYKYLRPWLGLGLLTSDGPHWHSHRKLITPTFHFKILESFFEVFAEKSKKMTRLLENKADGKVFDIYPYITHCALDIICETAMGVEVNAMDNTSNSAYVSAIYEISELTMQRALKPWLHNDFVFYNMSSLGIRYKHCLDILHGFTKKVIKERKEALKEKCLKPQLSEEDILLGKKKRMAFLDLLIDASEGGQKLSDNDIREEVDTFMFEGHDTTTAGICWSLFLLGNHPEVQDKVAEELEDIFCGEERPITLQDLGKMKYLDRVIKESLRLYPSVPFIARRITENINIDGYTIHKGCLSILHIFDVHRDPTQFSNPEKFDPDNFLPERCQHRHPYAYVPFSAGPRNCIGQKFAINEEKTVLASILRKYKIHAMEKPENIKLSMELILRPESGVLVKMEPRYK